eukprot:CAMPEP_0204546616 /NCGR_PEP_ID=MMETSP0661-20131031/22160_1 /ASSEMBLY_ACC=CAM_ASM_000606 /TAXON_ID=109239 /ORGANISM="Alexandrium margalefi, Strain AMGDE01CS-322" /LENGTH=271 /DNA_ID=CAMNT_0051553451 /DNA_START=62 /DNA_END=877 /DNA_ORIENTATION=+
MSSRMLVATLGCLLSPALAVPVDDSLAMVQASASASSAASSQALARSVAGRAMAMSKTTGFQAFNCTAHPKLCQPPFDCQTFTEAEYNTILVRGMAPEGRANLRTWCFSPDYEDYIGACVQEKDLVKAAKIQFRWSVDRHSTTGVDELDGSYCFIEGHCSNEAVTNETTMEEAEQMCDERYGREAWSKIGSIWKVPELPNFGNPKAADKTTGFHDPKITAFFLKMACAMGNYHCDVVYCKETYCKDPYFVRKYGHLLPRVPGQLLQTREKL